jgi:hypothetical protein
MMAADLSHETQLSSSHGRQQEGGGELALRLCYSIEKGVTALQAAVRGWLVRDQLMFFLRNDHIPSQIIAVLRTMNACQLRKFIRWITVFTAIVRGALQRMRLICKGKPTTRNCLLLSRNPGHKKCKCYKERRVIAMSLQHPNTATTTVFQQMDAFCPEIPSSLLSLEVQLISARTLCNLIQTERYRTTEAVMMSPHLSHLLMWITNSDETELWSLAFSVAFFVLTSYLFPNTSLRSIDSDIPAQPKVAHTCPAHATDADCCVSISIVESILRAVINVASTINDNRHNHLTTNQHVLFKSVSIAIHHSRKCPFILSAVLHGLPPSAFYTFMEKFSPSSSVYKLWNEIGLFPIVSSSEGLSLVHLFPLEASRPAPMTSLYATTTSVTTPSTSTISSNHRTLSRSSSESMVTTTDATFITMSSDDDESFSTTSAICVFETNRAQL